jgi:hypothetical protein
MCYAAVEGLKLCVLKGRRGMWWLWQRIEGSSIANEIDTKLAESFRRWESKWSGVEGWK